MKDEIRYILQRYYPIGSSVKSNLWGACREIELAVKKEKEKNKLYKIRPILRVMIEIPFISVRTLLFTDCQESGTREYIRVYVTVWKWSFDFVLYNTLERILK